MSNSDIKIESPGIIVDGFFRSQVNERLRHREDRKAVKHSRLLARLPGFEKKRPLLPTNDPRYARRLARSLNMLPDGFYVSGDLFDLPSNPRCNRAKVRVIRGARAGAGDNQPDGVEVIVTPIGGGKHYVVTGDRLTLAFFDCNGRAVLASRASN